MRVKITMILLLLVAVTTSVNAQAIDVTEEIAAKMKDSLNLSSNQGQDILDINRSIQNAKLEVRKHHSNVDSIKKLTQQIENTRDSLYREILQDAKFRIYLQKKRTLISVQ